MSNRLLKKKMEANRLSQNIKEVEKVCGKSDMTRRARQGLKILLDEIREMKKKTTPP